MEEDFAMTNVPNPLNWRDDRGRPQVQAPRAESDGQPSIPNTPIIQCRGPSLTMQNINSSICSPIPIRSGRHDHTALVANGSVTDSPHNPDPFRPSFSLQNNKPPTDPVIAQLAIESGVKIEPKYEGELTLATIRDRTCPEDQNTAVYITKVDPAWTTEEILECIHEGGIYKYSLQKPTQRYKSCAVTITFKYRRAAASFLHRAGTEGVFIKGQQVNVVPSIHHSWGIGEDRERQTRVLQIQGPEELLDAAKLEAHLHQHIAFNLVKREQWVEDGQRFVNFHFENILGKNPRLSIPWVSMH